MSAILKYPDLKIRRDYELERARGNPSCTNCDIADINAKWERLAQDRVRAETPATQPRIRP
jgi:hypothetical protein